MSNIFLFDAILKSSVTKVMYISSSAVFGDCETMPITDTTVRVPSNPVGNSQLFIENMLESLRISNKLSYAIVRRPEIAGLSEIEKDFFVKAN